MNPSSEKRLAKVHPELAKRVRAVAQALSARGIDIECVQGLRTFAEQDALYAQGRSKPGLRVTNARGGQSNHNYGIAVDVVPFVAGKPNWDAPDSTWQAIGQEGERHGLEWGGRWKKPVDRPHLQLPSGLNVAECLALYKKGGNKIQAVWAALETDGVEYDKPEPGPEVGGTAPALGVAVGLDAQPAPTAAPTQVNVEHADHVDTQAQTVLPGANKDDPPAEVPKVKPALWSRIKAAVLVATGISLPAGLTWGDLFGWLKDLPPHYVYAATFIGVASVVAGVWLYDRAAGRAAAQTKNNQDNVADPSKQNVVVVNR